MRIKKVGGRIIGAEMSAAEKKAMELEMRRQIAEYNQKNLNEIDALILWVLHEQFGFGAKRLKQFYNAFQNSVNDLMRRYEMEEGDENWLCTEMLKRIGVDVEQWHKELRLCLKKL